MQRRAVGSRRNKQGGRYEKILARERILDAALIQFSQFGLAGARTDAIAREAGVNKALLYYYFENKDKLYQAAFELVAARIVDSALASVAAGKTAGESLLRFALNHFDRLATQREFQSLIQHEMVRFHRGQTGGMPMLARSFFKPPLNSLESEAREGIRCRELCPVDWMQILYSSIGANVFYFLSAPIFEILLPFKAFAPASLQERRKAAIEFLGYALFRDRNHGAAVAKRVLAETPMPKHAATTFFKRASYRLFRKELPRRKYS